MKFQYTECRVDKYTYNYMYNFIDVFVIQHVQYGNGKRYVKNNSLDGLVCRRSNIFLQNELAV